MLLLRTHARAGTGCVELPTPSPERPLLGGGGDVGRTVGLQSLDTVCHSRGGANEWAYWRGSRGYARRGPTNHDRAGTPAPTIVHHSLIATF